MHIKTPNKKANSQESKGFNVNILNPSQIQFQFDSNVQPLPQALSRAEAVSLMKSSKSIQEWNLNRSKVIDSVGPEAFFHCGYHQDINASGLVTKIGLPKIVRKK